MINAAMFPRDSRPILARASEAELVKRLLLAELGTQRDPMIFVHVHTYYQIRRDNLKLREYDRHLATVYLIPDQIANAWSWLDLGNYFAGEAEGKEGLRGHLVNVCKEYCLYIEGFSERR